VNEKENSQPTAERGCFKRDKQKPVTSREDGGDESWKGEAGELRGKNKVADR